MNKKFRASALTLMVLMLGFLSACNTETAKENEGGEKGQPEVAVNPTPTTGKLDVLNPNLASKDEMAAMPHITEEIAQSILDNRPFMGMGLLNPFLEEAGLSEEQRKELYVKMFLPINLNNSDRPTIMMVPGIGKKMAHEFEEYRPYTSIEQFRREIGKYVDETEVARFESYVFVPVDLNTASDEEIKRIPGMGKKMLHEFKEYRPYLNMAQFNREIGKYVDDNELARLRSYVFVSSIPEEKVELEN